MWRAIVVVLIAVVVSSCATTSVPMEKLVYPGPLSQQKTLVIALRGLGGSVKDFEEYGFVDALHEAYPEADLICPDAHFGYYRERSLLLRLQEDVIDPAMAQGYTSIYLVGVSLGGLGSLLELQKDAAPFSAVVLLAPYSGDEDLHEAIKAYRAGQGPAPWLMEQDEREKSIAQLWQWIFDNDALFQSGKIWLGFGTDDRLSGHDLLAQLMPDNRVFRIEGAHRAEVFVQLWRDILAQSPFGDTQEKTLNSHRTRAFADVTH